MKSRRASRVGREPNIHYPSMGDIALTSMIVTGRVPLQDQKGDTDTLRKLKKSIRESGIPVGPQKIPRTDFIKVLEDIHEKSDMRYGQIINNALQLKYGRKDCDCGKDFMNGCKCKNSNGAAYNVFGIWDEELTEALGEFRRAYLHSASAGP